MRRLLAPLGATLVLLTAAACAGQNAGAPSANPPTANEATAFQARAALVADGWRKAPGADAWRTGFVPLQELTVVTGGAGFTDDIKQAFMAGWYRSATKLGTAAPERAPLTFADGQKLAVPLVSAAKAYQALDQGDPPPCQPPADQPVAPTGTGSDTSTSTTLPMSCTVLTVTDVKLGTVPLRTSRGEATVPAYLFTVAGLKSPVARVAVDPTAITKPPAAPAPSAGSQLPGLRSAQDLSKIDGTALTFRLGLGACDVDVKPLVAEYDDVVVVGGTARTKGDVCTDQLLLQPVTVTLAKPLGARLVLDGGSGQAMSLITER